MKETNGTRFGINQWDVDEEQLATNVPDMEIIISDDEELSKFLNIEPGYRYLVGICLIKLLFSDTNSMHSHFSIKNKFLLEESLNYFEIGWKRISNLQIFDCELRTKFWEFFCRIYSNVLYFPPNFSTSHRGHFQWHN